MQYQMSSKLLINNISKELNTLSDLIIKNDSLQINLEHVDHIDSAGIALFIELKQIAQTHGKNISFINLTSSITKLCQLYQVNL
ncbi:MAG: STAS domain-containing protein [Proteobacteria bacterium]|jgi:ABC-type transporter Mla MlaB component|nr:STAS domain-containing protein [Pseudomonadota bacterium]